LPADRKKAFSTEVEAKDAEATEEAAMRWREALLPPSLRTLRPSTFLCVESLATPSTVASYATESAMLNLGMAEHYTAARIASPPAEPIDAAETPPPN
jgi:hypothetical protein